MHVGEMRLVLRVPGAQSLKDKRQVVQKIRDRVRARFDVAIGEVENLDEHRQIVLGVAVVGDDGQVLRSVLDKITRYIEDLYVAELQWRDVDIHTYPSLR